MKALMCAALLLTASCVHAQFLDPNIIRQAGEAAASGNLRLGNVEIGEPHVGGVQYVGDAPRMPTAQEIATELRAQEQRAQRQREAEVRDAQRVRVRAAVERGYNAEFRK